jgi:hypothetical protein
LPSKRSAQEDLKAIMKGVKDVNREEETICETREGLKGEVCEFIDEYEGRARAK